MRGLGTAVGIGVIGTGIEYYLKQGESEADARKLAQEDIDKQKLGLGPGEEIVPSPTKPEGMRGSEIANRVTSAAVGADLLRSGLSGLPSAPSAIPSSKVSDPFAHLEGKKLTSGGSLGANREMEKNKTLWEKIVKVIKKASEKGLSKAMISKIYSKFGFAIAAKITAAIGGIVAAPFSVGISLLFSAIGIGMLLADVYDLYKWFVEYEKELDAYEKSTSPTPVDNSVTADLSGGYDANGVFTGVSPSPATSTPMATAASKVTPGGATPTSPSPAASASSIKQTSGDSRTAIEDYLGRKISDEENDMLMRAVYAEASANKDEYANVMAVILNRTRKNGGTIIDTLTEKNQFQAVTGTANNPGPSANFKRGPNEKSIAMINEGASSLSNISKSLDSFTSANRNAYGAGTNVAWLDKLQSSGGKQIGQTVFAENMYSGGGGRGGTTPAASSLASAPSTGNALTDLFAEYSTFRDNYMKQNGGGNTTVNAPVTNVSQSSGGGSNNTTPYNNDMMRYLLRPVT